VGKQSTGQPTTRERGNSVRRRSGKRILAAVGATVCSWCRYSGHRPIPRIDRPREARKVQTSFTPVVPGASNCPISPGYRMERGCIRLRWPPPCDYHQHLSEMKRNTSRIDRTPGRYYCAVPGPTPSESDPGHNILPRPTVNPARGRQQRSSYAANDTSCYHKRDAGT